MNVNIFGQIARIIERQIVNISKQAARLLKLAAKPLAALNNYVRQQVKAVTRPPSAKADYISAAGYYISKRALALSVMAAVAAVTLFSTTLYPWMEGRFWTPVILLNSAKMASYTGPAKLTNEVGTVIYEGDVTAGKITGSGTQYDTEGQLVYTGSFSDAAYEGQGAQYDGGILRYKGGFSQNRRAGQGEEYDETGALIYQGGFENGLRSGIGMEYRPDLHTLCYYGTFVQGQREGSGAAYEEDGTTLCYRGEFAAGLYEGTGRLYENGVLRYQGQFVQGQYEGFGTLYDDSGAPVYEGEFTAGQRQGTGTVYDALGASLFSGTFLGGSVNCMEYLGQAPQDITAAFGLPGYTEQAGGRLALIYLNLHTAFICMDAGDGTFLCDRVLTDASEGFLGVKENVTPEQLEELLGKRFSSLNLTLTQDRAAAFSRLSANVPKSGRVDKYRMSNYYIKVYYDTAGQKIAALECGSY